MFINREKELNILKNTLNKNKLSFVVIYGRRRIGKTETIRHFIKDNKLKHLEIIGVDGESKSTQIYMFLQALKEFDNTIGNPKIKTWAEAFQLLRSSLDKLNEKYKKVLFFDEFPWLNSHKSYFAKSFAHFLNNYCEKRKDLIIITCGSSASYMINKVIKNRQNLYSRITDKINMKQFDLSDTKKLLHSNGCQYNNSSLMDIYIALGGVAKYLQEINCSLQPNQNINNMCFDKDGLLVDEYNELYYSLFKNAETHKKIMNLLSTKWSGFTQNEIINNLSLSSSTINTPLEELENSGLIFSSKKFAKEKKETVYRSSDCFSFFHNKWIKKHKGKNWNNLSLSNGYRTWKDF